MTADLYERGAFAVGFGPAALVLLPCDKDKVLQPRRDATHWLAVFWTTDAYDTRLFWRTYLIPERSPGDAYHEFRYGDIVRHADGSGEMAPDKSRVDLGALIDLSFRLIRLPNGYKGDVA